MIEIILCATNKDYQIAKKIISDYLDWLELDVRYQGVEKELETLNKIYSSQAGGAFIFGYLSGKPVGGVGFRSHSVEVCEMKRFYIYPEHRLQGFGQILCKNIIEIAWTYGYKKMRLDTLSRLYQANRLYEKIGFYPIKPYIKNPFEDAIFLEIELKSTFT